MSITLPDGLAAAVEQDAQSLAITQNAVIRMRLKQRYDQMAGKAYVIPVHNYANDDDQMRCPKCGSTNVLELNNLHTLWGCGNCGYQDDGACFDAVEPSQ